MKTKETTSTASRMGAYLTAGIGLTALAGQADGATTVINGGEGVRTITIAGTTLSFVPVFSGANFINLDGPVSAAGLGYNGATRFTQGADLNPTGTLNPGDFQYSHYGSTGVSGSVMGAFNYANISFDGDPTTTEAVVMFYMDGNTGLGYIAAIARNDDDSNLSITDGKAAIDAVPEPSSLVLLALGSAGLLARRRRQAT